MAKRLNKKAEGGGIGIVGPLIILSVILLIIFVVVIGVTHSNKVLEYCKENGWDGVRINDDRCYKDVADDSGLGTKRIVSGDVSQDIKERNKHGKTTTNNNE